MSRNVSMSGIWGCFSLKTLWIYYILGVLMTLMMWLSYRYPGQTCSLPRICTFGCLNFRLTVRRVGGGGCSSHTSIIIGIGRIQVNMIGIISVINEVNLLKLYIYLHKCRWLTKAHNSIMLFCYNKASENTQACPTYSSYITFL